jgi:hypothetical protein
VTAEEVKKVCRKLKIRDWTQLKEPRVMPDEAKTILAELRTGRMIIPPDNFRLGLEVELEHGTRFPEANVTNNHPILTGKIVLAHFRESSDYYQRLEVAEIEGDILKAVAAKNAQKVEALQRKLIKARLALSQAESAAL